MVVRSGFWSGIDGEGKTASEAWINAAERLYISQLRQRVFELEGELLKLDICPKCFMSLSKPHCCS